MTTSTLPRLADPSPAVDTPTGPVSPMPVGADRVEGAGGSVAAAAVGTAAALSTLPADFDVAREYLPAPAVYTPAPYLPMVGPLTPAPQTSLADVVKAVAG